MFKKLPYWLNLLPLFQFKYIIDEETKCWNWISNKNDHNYGYIMYKNEYYYAHRVSFLIYNKYINDDLDVLHSCDNPPCVNPEHLSQGTRKQNNDDKMNKGRFIIMKGILNGRADHSEKEIIEIREKAARGISYQDLAKEYKDSPSHIAKIATGFLWKNLAGPLSNRDTLGTNNGMAQLNDDIVLEIREEYESGIPQYQLAEKHNVSQALISLIVLGKLWLHVGGPLSNGIKRTTKIPQNEYQTIIQKSRMGQSNRSLAKEYGVSPGLIQYILKIYS
jgi:HNH endonuclease